jgi:hypothetical protein
MVSLTLRLSFIHAKRTETFSDFILIRSVSRGHKNLNVLACKFLDFAEEIVTQCTIKATHNIIKPAPLDTPTLYILEHNSLVIF